MSWDIVIIGSGPAGMTAALEAVKHGLKVLVLDRKAEPGGQIFCNVGQASEKALESMGKDYSRGLQLVKDFKASEAKLMSEADVWHITPGRVYVSTRGESQVLMCKHILMATGAMERPAPIEGWDLPGVMGAGAADVLLKSSGMLPQGPVIICGNGPLILQSVQHFNKLNIPIAGVVLTGKSTNLLKSALYSPLALSRPLYMGRGLGMGLGLVTKNKFFLNAKNLKIEKDNEFSLSFTSLANKKVKLQGKSIILHEGVVSEPRISYLAQCRHKWDQHQRYWHVDTDKWGQTSIAGISAAGDCSGVLGADASMEKGRLAALEIVRQLGFIDLKARDALGRNSLRQLRRYKAMQVFMDQVFRPSMDSINISDETIICRCESLTAGELRKVISDGCYSLDSLKAQSRSGMGACQGRNCALSAAELISNVHGIPMENLAPYRAQFPLVPLSLKELAEMYIPSEGL